VSDVRYPMRSDSPFGQVTFTMTRVPQEARVKRPSRAERARTGTYVTNITCYLDETGEMGQMPAPARKLASFLTLLIEAATGTPTAVEHDSGIRCRTKACPGIIRTSLTASRDTIEWRCPVCGHNGIITGWEDTKWNQMKRSGGAD
jgi:hypothetical protein